MGPIENRVIATLAGSQLTMDSRNGVELLQATPFLVAHTNSGYIQFDSDAPFTIAGVFNNSNPAANASSFMRVQNANSPEFWQYSYAPGDNGTLLPFPHITGNMPSPAPAGTYVLSWGHSPGFQMSNFRVDWFKATLTTVPEPAALGTLSLGLPLFSRRRRGQSYILPAAN